MFNCLGIINQFSWISKIVKFRLLSFDLIQKKVTKKKSRLDTKIGVSKSKVFVAPDEAWKYGRFAFHCQMLRLAMLEPNARIPFPRNAGIFVSGRFYWKKWRSKLARFRCGFILGVFWNFQNAGLSAHWALTSLN